MKKILTSILTAAMAFTPALGSYAAVDIDYKSSSRTITITGSTDYESATPVTVHMYKATSEFPTSENLPIASAMTKLDSSGGYTVVFDLPQNAQNGKYYVLCGHKETEKTSIILYDLDSKETKAVVTELNQAKTTDEFSALCSDSAKMALLGIDLETEEYMSDVSSGVFAIKESTYTANDYVQAFGFMSAVIKIQNENNPGETLKSEIRAFDAQYSDYENLDEKIKNEVEYILLNSDFSDGIESLAQIIATAKVRLCASYGDVMDVIDENCDVLDIDLDSYKDLEINNRHKVPLRVFEKRNDILSSYEIKEIFDDEVKKISKAEEDEDDSPKKPSSGGGGGSKGGSVVGVSQNFIAENQNPTTGNESGSSLIFSDIQNHFAKYEIEALAQKGIISGYEDGTFRPESFVTRAEFSALVSRAFDLDPANSDAGFADVDKDSWYYGYVGIMSENGYIFGDGKSFFPENSITRQDAAVIIARMLGLEDGTCAFSDNNAIADYACGKVGALVEKGYMVGYENMFRPCDFITRGETAVLISRVMKN